MKWPKTNLRGIVRYFNNSGQIHRVGKQAIYNEDRIGWLFNGKYHKVNGISFGKDGSYSYHDLYERTIHINIGRLVI